MAPTATTPSTISELVPAAASTPGIVNTPVPMMLPTTSPVAEVRPSPWSCSGLAGDAGWADPSGGCGADRVLAALDMPNSPQEIPGRDRFIGQEFASPAPTVRAGQRNTAYRGIDGSYFQTAQQGE